MSFNYAYVCHRGWLSWECALTDAETDLGGNNSRSSSSAQRRARPTRPQPSLSLCPHPIPHRPCPGDRGHRSSSATARGGSARRHHRQPSRGGRTKAGLENKLRVALDLRAPDLTMRAYLGGRGGVSKSSKQMRSRGFCGSAGRGGPLGRIKVVAGGAFSNLAYPSSARIPIAD